MKNKEIEKTLKEAAENTDEFFVQEANSGPSLQDVHAYIEELEERIEELEQENNDLQHELDELNKRD